MIVQQVISNDPTKIETKKNAIKKTMKVGMRGDSTSSRFCPDSGVVGEKLI